MDNNQTAKKHLIDNVLVAMAQYLTAEVLQILERVLAEELVKVVMEEITTLPAEVQDSVDEQNQYIIRLFLYKKKKLKDGTKYNYLNSVKRLITLIYKPLNQIDEIDIYRFLDWYEHHNGNTGQKNQPVTINNERRNLCAFYSWMRKEKLIAYNPVESIEPQKVIRKPIDYFQPMEIAKLRDGCETLRERAIVEVLRSTGARVGEVVEITKDMINWETGDILILTEKGGRYRTIYLDPEARYHLHKYLNSREDYTPQLFVHARKPYKSLSTCGVRMILKDIASRVDITSRVYPHKLRKTLGMELKNRGVDIGTIQEILGHANSQVTEDYYAQSNPQTLRIVRERTAA
nr:MAG TPA: SITE SPECIFIC RECOMBINASE XERD [Caudoviricetes sp.]